MCFPPGGPPKAPRGSQNDPWEHPGRPQERPRKRQERLGSALDERLGGTGGLQDTCDDLGYRTLGLGFGLLTLGLISGAVWANEAWGAYWSWDPKETWALITWLVYAIYLHTRLSDEYSQGDSNRVAVAGFVVTWVCYLGVNLFGVGLHSYGFLSS